jgi:uncharacterized protein YvpB
MYQNVMPRPFLGIYVLNRLPLVKDRTEASVPTDSRVYLPVPHYRQQRSLSCEMASLRMAAQYHKVTHTETELVQLMPTDTTQPKLSGGKVIWADANRVFAGNIRGWQFYYNGLSHYPYRSRAKGWGYGIHALGIAEVATKIGLQVEVFDEVDYVYKILDGGEVAVVLVPCSGRSTSRKWSWYTSKGVAVTVIDGEHAIVVRGYNGQHVWVNDPLGRVSVYERIVFERAFRLLSMGVRIGPSVPTVPVPQKPEPPGPPFPPGRR